MESVVTSLFFSGISNMSFFFFSCLAWYRFIAFIDFFKDRAFDLIDFLSQLSIL